MPKLGDVVPLSVQLFDGDPNLFAGAIVTDNDGVAVSGSPFALVSIGEGLYELDTFLMPNKSFVSAVYKIFLDSGFTSESPIHSDSIDNFPLIFIDQEFIDAITEVKVLLELILAKGVTVEIQGIVDQADEIIGSLLKQDEEIKGIVEASEDDIIGIIEDKEKEVKGIVDDNEEIEGDIDD